jgi:hypothetical protein
MEKLTWKKINNSNDVISIDLHNGYEIIAVSGRTGKDTYTTTLFLKEYIVPKWDLIEGAGNLTFHTKNINSTILKQIAKFLEEGFFDYYIERFEYEMKCFDRGNDFFEQERKGE